MGFGLSERDSMNDMSMFDGGQLNPSNRRELIDIIRKRYYVPPMLQLYQSAIEQVGLPCAVDHLASIMREGQSKVEALLVERKNSREIHDVDQARKSVAGHAFQALVFCALASLQAAGLIPAHLIFTLKTRKNPFLGKSVIEVGPEKIKPDVDLLIYSDTNNNAPVCIYSLKTSLRERSGQTHRWKVLLDIVTAQNCRSIKQKYDLKYDGSANFLMAMITTNFYDEITSPQQRGLLRFFDYVYLTKPDDFAHPITRFSDIARDLTKVYDC